MESQHNQSFATFFIFQGLTSNQKLEHCLFLLFLVDYLLTVSVNIAIVCIILAETQLHKPMYFLLSNLTFLEIWYISSTMPKTLVDLLQHVKMISFAGCFTQFYFIFSLGTIECFLLVLMGYDRFLAICMPLQYHKLMSCQVCFYLALCCWVTGFLWFLTPIVMISQLPLCGPNMIDHFLCDQGPLMTLSCLHDTITEVTFFTFATVLSLGSLIFILVSYINIISTVLRMPSVTGRQKAFSTCASHLTVVFIYFGSGMFMYLRPSGNHSYSMDKEVALVYTVITPLLNPLIYALRSKDIRQALSKGLRKIY